MQAACERLMSKSFEHILETELKMDYDLSPVEAKVLSERLIQLIEGSNGSHFRPGQALFSTVSASEPASKPINRCRQVPIRVNLVLKEDMETALRGVPTLRRKRLLRMSEEAFSRGGLFTQEDLSIILGCDIRTIRRDIAHLKRRGVFVPTRGAVKDMGRGISHKAKAVELLLKGRQFSEISRDLYHSPSAIYRYLKTFLAVCTLFLEGLSRDKIAQVVSISEGLLEEYLSLYKCYVAKNPKRLEGLRKRLKPHKKGA